MIEIRGLEGLQEQTSVRFMGLPLHQGLKKLPINFIIVWQTAPPSVQRPALVFVLSRPGGSPLAGSPEAERPRVRDEAAVVLDDTTPGGQTETRLQALQHLYHTDQADEATVLTALSQALTDDDVTVKRYAIQALANWGGTDAVGSLHQTFRDPDPAIRLLILEQVAGRDEGRFLVQEALTDPDEAVRALAASILEQAGAEEREEGAVGEKGPSREDNRQDGLARRAKWAEKDTPTLR